MTVHEYIKETFGSLGIQLSSAELSDFYLEDEVLTEDLRKDAQIKIVKYIPTLLLRPNVSESGFSITYNKDSLLAYYDLKTKELGLYNHLKPKVRFL